MGKMTDLPHPSFNLILLQIRVSLDFANANAADQQLPSSTDENGLLPISRLTPKTLLGGQRQSERLSVSCMPHRLRVPSPQEPHTKIGQCD